MQIEVTDLQTKQTMYASLRNSSKDEQRYFLNFYRRFKENGRKKYHVKVVK